MSTSQPAGTTAIPAAAKGNLAKLARSLLKEKAERIAVIGMACRFPGAGSVGEFRDLLLHGINAASDIPVNRWDSRAYYSEIPGIKGKTHVRRAGFCAGFEQFDNELFGLSPREAETMDPQHRALLEVTWEALSSAGMRKETLAGTSTGVFVGISAFDYGERFAPAERDAFMSTGLAHSTAAGRLAYYFDLKGATESIDTACSSSLVAVHRACTALRNREVDTALVGGVNAMFSPSVHISFSQAGMLSADGRCRTFDDSASGYGRGEGCGVVLLKRLSDARRDSDSVLAVIAGSAVNHNGRSQGMTAPNGPAQQAVIRCALNSAGIAPENLGYVEAHGTGTPLGDPIELNALAAVAGKRIHGRRLPVGSVKTNIGHLEASAGIAGLIKAILIAEQGEIFPQLHLSRANKHLALDRASLCLTDVRRPLPADRSAIGVSSFGFSGTNAHAVIEPAPRDSSEHALDASRPQLLQISARSARALSDLAGRLARYLSETPSTGLADIAVFLRRSDTGAKHRFACVARTHNEATAALHRLTAAGSLPAGSYTGVAKRNPKVALLFTGQGSQYSGMAQGLYQSDAAFRATLDEVAAAMAGELDRPLLDLLFDPTLGPELDETKYCQPALFAIEYALAAHFRTAGVEPAALLGHSVGEIAAAAVAEVLPLSEAARLVCRRGALMHRTDSDAAMLAVSAEAGELRALLTDESLNEVVIAAVNGPRDTVVSGSLASMERLENLLANREIRSQRLSVTRAFHSSLMDGILGEFGRFASELSFRRPQLPVVSNVTGALVESMSAEYLCDQLRRTVLFHDGVKTLQDMSIDATVEIGPTPHLTGLTTGAIRSSIAVIPTLRPDLDDETALLRAFASLYSIGLTFEVDNETGRTAVAGQPPPVAAFDRRVFLAAPVESSAPPVRAERRFHPWLSGPLESPLPARQFPCHLDIEGNPMLAEHRIYGLEVFPASGYVDLVTSAVRQVTGNDRCTIRDVRLLRALVVSDAGADVQLVLHAGPDEKLTSTRFRWEVFSRQSADSWVRHADGAVDVMAAAPDGTPDVVTDTSAAEPMEPDSLYSLLQYRGMAYSGSFRALDKVWRGPVGSGMSFGTTRPPQDRDAGPGHIVHPALLDAAFQLISVAMTTVPALENSVQSVFMPVSFDAVHVLSELTGPADCTAAVHLDDAGMLSHADIVVRGPSGPIAHIEGMRLQPVTRQQVADGAGPADTVGDLLAELRGLPSEQRDARLREFLTDRVAEILQIAPDEVDSGAPYFELGMTSLASMELRYSIRRRLNCTTPSALVLDYESTDTLAEQLLDIVESTIENQEGRE
jgi:acyl transferase domain-containing protein